MSADLTVTVDIEGIERLIKEVPGKVAAFMDSEAELVVNDIKQSFGTGPGGRSYKRGGKVHIASQPGFPPNVDIGTLINSIEWRTIGRFSRSIIGALHGLYLELGTDKPLKGGQEGPKEQGIAPRPFIRPAFDRRRKALADDARQFGLVK